MQSVHVQQTARVGYRRHSELTITLLRNYRD
jgi:hypothetical protein